MATKSKHRKNHKQKVEARNKRLADQKRKNEKFQREFIMNLIKQEQEKGLFENSQSITDGPLSGPMLNSIDPIVSTPISGPVLDGPVLDATEALVESQEILENSENAEETSETTTEE